MKNIGILAFWAFGIWNFGILSNPKDAPSEMLQKLSNIHFRNFICSPNFFWRTSKTLIFHLFWPSGPTLGPFGAQTRVFLDMTPSLSCRAAQNFISMSEPATFNDDFSNKSNLKKGGIISKTVQQLDVFL